MKKIKLMHTINALMARITSVYYKFVNKHDDSLTVIYPY